MNNNSLFNPTALSSSNQKNYKYIPVNVLNYIDEYKAIEISSYMEAVSIKLGLDFDRFGKYVEEMLATLNLENKTSIVAYIKAVIKTIGSKNTQRFRKEWKMGVFNGLYEELDKNEIFGTKKEKVLIECIENHLLNEYLTTDELIQMNHNIISYMANKNEHDLCKFIDCIKRSKHLKEKTNIPYEMFEKEAERLVSEWDEIVKEIEGE